MITTLRNQIRCIWRLSVPWSLVVLAACSPGADRFGAFPNSDFQRRIAFAEDLTQQNRPAEAAEVYRQTLQAADTPRQRLTTLTQLGWLQLNTGAYAEAESAFREALDLSARNGDAALGLGTTLTLVNRHTEAEAVLIEAVKHGESRAYSPLGVVLDLQGKHLEAQDIYLSGRKSLPEDRALIANLSLSYAMSENYAAALQLSRPLARLIVPERFKRNHVMILAMAGRADLAQTEGASLGLQAEDIQKVVAMGKMIRKNRNANRVRYLRD